MYLGTEDQEWSQEWKYIKPKKGNIHTLSGERREGNVREY